MKINFDIDTYKTRFLGGARSYLFYALIQFPSGINNIEKQNYRSLLTPFGYGSANDFVPYLVKSTSIPESSFEDISIPYPGHTFKMAGNRSYGNWSVSFNVDEKTEILRMFNDWHNLIYDASEQKSSEPEVYMKDQFLYLINGVGEAIRSYQLVNAWPLSISQTDLNYSNIDITSVDITFSYQYYITLKEKENAETNSLLKALFNKITGSALKIPRF